VSSVTASPIHAAFQARKPGLEQETGFPVFVSGLVGPLRLFQRKGGHRHSIDDAATAWYALQHAPAVSRCLDLGTGVGSVGLAVLHGLPQDARLTCIEAQQVSHQLLLENIACNGLQDRVTPLFGDLRSLVLPETFPLVTGSPPYFPAEKGTIPADTQKAHARFELRGHVGDYALAAKRHLAPDGRFVFCFPSLQKARCIQLVHEAGLHISHLRDVHPRENRPPLFTLFCARLAPVAKLETESPFLVADAEGRYTPEMVAFQASRGFGPDGTNRLESGSPAS
jgi:tRNA1Val (adenine37-N6)-methyltransferase